MFTDQRTAKKQNLDQETILDDQKDLQSEFSLESGPSALLFYTTKPLEILEFVLLNRIYSWRPDQMILYHNSSL